MAQCENAAALNYMHRDDRHARLMVQGEVFCRVSGGIMSNSLLEFEYSAENRKLARAEHLHCAPFARTSLVWSMKT